MPERCGWVVRGDALYAEYHDREWGVPVRDVRPLFELLSLEGAQAGLSWRTVLHRREAYRQAFAGFDPEVVARFDDADIERLVHDPGIIRHRGKIEAVVGNARALLALSEREGSFADFLWSFVGKAPQIHHFSDGRDIPVTSLEAREMAKALRAHGFVFVGPTTCYAFMQAAGLVMDHETGCFRHAELAR